MLEVNTIESRIKFVKNQATGPGTGFPIEVTLDQLAEIHYRVKDAEFTAGNFAFTDSHDVTFGLGLYGTRGAAMVAADGDQPEVSATEVSARGLIAIAEGGGTPLPDIGNKFGGNYKIGGSSPGAFTARDISDSELGLWVSDDTVIGNYWDSTALDHLLRSFAGGQGIYPLSYRTGLSLNSIVQGYIDEPTVYGIFGNTEGGFFYSGAEVTLVPQVAVSGDDPFAPGATLHLGIQFLATWGGQATAGGILSSHCEGLSSAGCKLKIKLASSEVSCPLYWHGDGEITSQTDFVLTAKKWWPYAKGAGEAVWDEDTGAML